MEVFFCGFLITYTAHFMYNITVPSRYVALLNVCNCKTFRRGDICRCYFLGSIFYHHSVVGGYTYFIDTKMGGADVIALTRAFWFAKIKSTMVGLIQRRPTTFRRIGEMSRWRRLCTRRYVLGDVQSENMFINGMGFLGSRFYWQNVVGGNTYSIDTKMGARIHRTVTLRCVQMHIQL